MVAKIKKYGHSTVVLAFHHKAIKTNMISTPFTNFYLLFHRRTTIHINNGNLFVWDSYFKNTRKQFIRFNMLPYNNTFNHHFANGLTYLPFLIYLKFSSPNLFHSRSKTFVFIFYDSLFFSLSHLFSVLVLFAFCIRRNSVFFFIRPFRSGFLQFSAKYENESLAK